MKSKQFGKTVVLAFVIWFSFFELASADTGVSGLISSNTIWSLENSPYSLIKNVQIAQGVTLTIEPGVIVNGRHKNLQIWGTLNAIGNSTSKIIFNNTNIKPGVNGKFEFLIRIEFSEINGGSLYSPTGLIKGSLILKDSLLRDIPYIYLYYPESDSYIERNIFIHTGGISTGNSKGSAAIIYIRNNVFYKQSTPYAVENWAGDSDGETIVEHNSFLSTNKIALRLRIKATGAKMSAINNYWNTTDTSIIDSMIFDKNDDLSTAGYITYTPFLILPHINTPKLLPVADAGSDQMVVKGATVILDGTNSSDTDGTITSYLWKQTGGIPVTLSDAALSQPTFTAPLITSSIEMLTFELTVGNEGGLKGSDSVVVTVSADSILPLKIMSINKKKGFFEKKLKITGVSFGEKEGKVLIVRKKVETEFNDILSWSISKLEVRIPWGVLTGKSKIYVEDSYGNRSEGKKFYYRKRSPKIRKLIAKKKLMTGDEITLKGRYFGPEQGEGGMIIAKGASVSVITWTNKSIVLSLDTISKKKLQILVQTMYGRSRQKRKSHLIPSDGIVNSL